MKKRNERGKVWLQGGAVLLFLLIAAPAFAGWLGISVTDVTSDRLSALKLKEERGVEITNVWQDSPAAKAGLKEHDVVLEYNGQRVESVEQFQRLVHETPAGRAARLLISRDGAPQTITAKVGEPQAVPGQRGQVITVRPPNSGQPFVFTMPEMPRVPNMDELLNRNGVTILNLAGPRIGVDLEPLNAQLGEYFGVAGGEGVLVRSVDSGSAAEKAGIKAGDVIVKVDGEKVTTSNGLRTALNRKADKGEVPLTLVRNHKEMTVTVKVEPPARRLTLPSRGVRM